MKTKIKIRIKLTLSIICFAILFISCGGKTKKVKADTIQQAQEKTNFKYKRTFYTIWPNQNKMRNDKYMIDTFNYIKIIDTTYLNYIGMEGYPMRIKNYKSSPDSLCLFFDIKDSISSNNDTVYYDVFGNTYGDESFRKSEIVKIDSLFWKFKDDDYYLFVDSVDLAKTGLGYMSAFDDNLYYKEWFGHYSHDIMSGEEGSEKGLLYDFYFDKEICVLVNVSVTVYRDIFYCEVLSASNDEISFYKTSENENENENEKVPYVSIKKQNGIYYIKGVDIKDKNYNNDVWVKVKRTDDTSEANSLYN